VRGVHREGMENEKSWRRGGVTLRERKGKSGGEGAKEGGGNGRE